jgi:hypothetical protein
VAVAAGLVLGQVGDLSATCPRGRGRVGCLVSGEDSAGGGTVGSALDSHGFRDGGGLTQAFTDTPVTDTPTRRIHSTPTPATGEKTKGGLNYVVA